jgi:excisionase family DNA binding protein
MPSAAAKRAPTKRVPVKRANPLGEPPPANRAERRARLRAEDLLDTHEACAYLRVSRTTLREYIRAGFIHPIRLGPKLLRFDVDDLDGALS